MDENPDKRITSDGELIKAFLAGSQEAVDSLYKKHHSSLFNYGRSFLSRNRCNSPDFHGGDIDNRAWHNGLTKIDTLKDLEAFPAWMRTIIRHEAIQHLKDCVKDGQPLDDQTPDGHVIPIDQVIESAQQAEAILKMARSISPRFGQIFYARDVEGQKLKDIAADLGDTYVNVRNIYYRGIKRLRKMLEETD
jgi:RNA polymerase sigma factor (sigma-70 family)